jgi:purine-binding chemotaxis protein CheW
MKMNNQLTELVLFDVNKLNCGLNIDEVQEITRQFKLTRIHNSEPFVRGVINLRGQILTVVDLRVKLGFEPLEINPQMRLLIVEYDSERLALLVDRVLDIVPVSETQLEPPPSNLNSVSGEFFSAIFKMDRQLITILDLAVTIAASGNYSANNQKYLTA